MDSVGVSSFKMPQLKDENHFLIPFNQKPLIVTASGNTFLFNADTESFEAFTSIPTEYGRINEISAYPGGQGLIMAAASRLTYLEYNDSRSEFELVTIAENIEKYVVAGQNIFYQHSEQGLMMTSYTDRGFRNKKVYSFEGFHSLKELAFTEVSCMYYDPVLRSIWLDTDEGLLNLFPLKFERVNDNITTYEITSVTHLKNGLGFCVAGGNIFKTELNSDGYLTERLNFT